MPEMESFLKFVGFQFDGNKCSFSTDEVSEIEVVNRFEGVSAKIDEEEKLSLFETNSVPFEEIMYNDDTSSLNNPYLEDGPKMVRKLGEMPSGHNNRGFSNSISLILFLAIDLIAIGVGLLFLMS